LRTAVLDCLGSGKVQLGFAGIESVNRERLLQIDPPLQVVGDEEMLLLSFTGKGISVEVAARHEDKLTAIKPLLAEEHVHLLKCFGDIDATIHLLLGDASQLGAEGSQCGVKRGLDVGLEHRLDGLSAHVDNHDWELYDFLRLHLDSLVVGASALKVKHADVVERCLVSELASLEVQNVSEVSRW